MPQFEIETIGDSGNVQRIRARDEKDAVLRMGKWTEEDGIRIVDQRELEGWRMIVVNGKPSGRVRPFQRMKFRRD